MRQFLMVSFTSQGQTEWFDQWVEMNRACVSSVYKASRTVTTTAGDTYRWVLLGPGIEGTEPDAVFLDDRFSHKPTAEQEHWLRVLPTRVGRRYIP